MSELRKGLRVCIPGVNGINRGTVVEVARLTTGVGHHDDDSERNVVHGALVQLDDGRKVHRWQDEIIVGKQVLEAILKNQPYIFTDPSMRRMVESRMRKIMAGYDWADTCDSLAGVKQGSLPRP